MHRHVTTANYFYKRLPMSWQNIIQLALFHLIKTMTTDGRIPGEPALDPDILQRMAGKRGCATTASNSQSSQDGVANFTSSTIPSTPIPAVDIEQILSNRRVGFFRWREDICRTIDECWDYLQPGRQRTASWQNSVSSILSSNPDMFVSGQLVVRQSGWWSLTVIQVPVPLNSGALVYSMDELSLVLGKDVIYAANPTTQPNGECTSLAIPTASTTAVMTSLSSTTPAECSTPPADANRLKAELLQKLQSVDPDILKAAIAQSKRTIASLQKAVVKKDKESGDGSVGANPGPRKQRRSKDDTDSLECGNIEKEKRARRKRRQTEEEEIANQNEADDQLISHNDESEQKKKKRRRQKLTDELDAESQISNSNLPGLNHSECTCHVEDEYQHLQQEECQECNKHRSIHYGNEEDDFIYDEYYTCSHKHDNQAMDGQLTSLSYTHPRVDMHQYSFTATILGISSMVKPYPPPLLWDPFSACYVPLYINRFDQGHFSCPRLELLNEIKKRGHSNALITNQNTSTIDLCKLRPEWLPALTRFLRTAFWPGITIYDSLDYPELCVLAMYNKHLIIGAGLMNPNGQISFLAIHPEWRSKSLAKRILNYLTNHAQKRLDCPSVSLVMPIDSPALITCQKLGFRLASYLPRHFEPMHNLTLAQQKEIELEIGEVGISRCGLMTRVPVSGYADSELACNAAFLIGAGGGLPWTITTQTLSIHAFLLKLSMNQQHQ